MKKSTKLFKRFFALLLVVLMSIESIGAVVSDNDGSAFITKAEFDSLKNNFQSQIDQYNTSIDSKIDGAIASYLAGINVQVWKKNSIINSDWKEISCFNGNILPGYELPSFTGAWVFNNAYKETPDNVRREDWKNFNLILTSSYDGSNNFMTRPLCTGNEEGVSSYTNGIVWDGITNYWTESWNLTSITKKANSPYALNDPVNFTFTASVNNLHDLRYNGYVQNLSDLSTYNRPTFTYVVREKSTGNVNETTYSITEGNYVKKMVTNVVIKEPSSEARNYRHIIQYDKSTTWTLSNPNFLNTFRINNNNTKTSKSLNDSSTINKNFSLAAFDVRSYDNVNVISSNNVTGLTTGRYALYKLNDGDVALALSDDVESTLPSIGMLPSDVAANSIKQFSSNINWFLDKDEWTIAPPTLEQGIPVLRGKSGMKFKWDIMFKQGKTYNTTTNSYVNSSDNPIIMLSNGPFIDKDQPSALIETSVDGGVTKQNYQIIPVNTKKTLEWTLENDGIVYAKWWNNATDPSATNWIHTLDVANSSTFEYIEEN